LTSVKVVSRKDPFVNKVKTSIWKETATEKQGYLSDRAAYFGYDIIELMQTGYSQTDITFLLLQGELPTLKQRQLFDALAVLLSNPGPRHPATRAVMEAAVSKTRSQHLLPIGLMVLGGEQAAQGVETIMRFLRLNRRKTPATLAEVSIDKYKGPQNDLEILPGFGPCFEQRQPLYRQFASSIQVKFHDYQLRYLEWSLSMDEALEETPCGIKATCLAGAILLDLGFHPRSGPGIFQLLSAPGLLAHGLEMANQPVSAMPFVSDENYHHVGKS
jgi:citrate synthase